MLTIDKLNIRKQNGHFQLMLLWPFGVILQVADLRRIWDMNRLEFYWQQQGPSWGEQFIQNFKWTMINVFPCTGPLSTGQCPGTYPPGKKALLSYDLDLMLGTCFFGTGVYSNKTLLAKLYSHCSVPVLSEQLYCREILRERNGMIHSGERQM